MSVSLSYTFSSHKMCAVHYVVDPVILDEPLTANCLWWSVVCNSTSCLEFDEALF